MPRIEREKCFVQANAANKTNAMIYKGAAYVRVEKELWRRRQDDQLAQIERVMSLGKTLSNAVLEDFGVLVDRRV